MTLQFLSDGPLKFKSQIHDMKWLLSKINTWSSSLSSERVLHMTGVPVNALVVCFRRDIVWNPWQKRRVNNSSHYWLQLENNTKKTVTTFCIAWYLCIVTHTITHYISWLKIYLCVGKGFGSFCEHVSVVELMGQLVILYNICSRGRTFKSFHQQIFSWTITWSWVK